MRNDLVHWLRDPNCAVEAHANMMLRCEAADRIESLQAQLLEKDLTLVMINAELRKRIRELEAVLDRT